jgi:hypothetical protein
LNIPTTPKFSETGGQATDSSFSGRKASDSPGFFSGCATHHMPDKERRKIKLAYRPIFGYIRLP